MNNIIKFATIALAALTVIGCAKETKEAASQEKLVPVEVSFNIDMEDVVGDLTRANVSLFPEVENWIFDYYYVQFYSTGMSRTSGHRRTTVTMGDLEVRDQVWLYDLGECTITFVANIVPAGATYGDNPGWENTSTGVILIADNIDTYKTLKFDMTKRLQASEITPGQNGSLKHMPMCGYWEGSVTTANNTESDPFHMSVTLGRMVSKLIVNVNNMSGSAIRTVKLDKAATAAYIFPQAENDVLEDDEYMSVTNSVNIANNASSTLYFYTAPNFCETGGNVTTLTFTAANGKSATIPVGSDVDDGDYNLYMNTIYTLNVDLK